jgi:hypothetical protein
MYRRAGTKTKPDRGIFVKHFKNIPMADMEIVLVRSSICMQRLFSCFSVSVVIVDLTFELIW